MTFGMLCSWIDAARLSQNATDHVLNAGATTPIEAPAKVNWLYLPTICRPSMYLMVGSGKRGSMQVSSIASYLPSAAKASGENAAISPAPAATCRKRRRSNRLLRRSAQQLQPCACRVMSVIVAPRDWCCIPPTAWPAALPAHPSPVRGGMTSLARPKDARHPVDLVDREGAVAVFGVERFELDRLGRALAQFLDHDLAVAGPDHDAVAFADRARRRDDDGVAGPVGRLHRFARDFQGIGLLVGDVGEFDLVPALADREARIVEMPAFAGLGETDHRHRRDRRLHAVGDQGDERVHLGAGGGERLGDRFGGRPALAAFRRDALGLVEGGRVEAGLLGQAGCGELVARRESVEGIPDLGVCEHKWAPRARARSSPWQGIST